MAASFKDCSPRETMNHMGLPSWKLPFLARDLLALMRENIATIKLFPGVDGVLSHLAQCGIPLAVVSSNSGVNVRVVLGEGNTGLINHFECGMSIFDKADRIRKTLDGLEAPGCEAIY